MLLQALAESENTVYQSSLGAKTLISGWKTPDDSDPSLLPRLIGKTLVLKDYTELMSYWDSGILGPSEPLSGIPEPATLGLLLVGGLAVLGGRQRDRFEIVGSRG